MSCHCTPLRHQQFFTDLANLAAYSPVLDSSSAQILDSIVVVWLQRQSVLHFIESLWHVAVSRWTDRCFVATLHNIPCCIDDVNNNTDDDNNDDDNNDDDYSYMQTPTTRMELAVLFCLMRMQAWLQMSQTRCLPQKNSDLHATSIRH